VQPPYNNCEKSDFSQGRENSRASNARPYNIGIAKLCGFAVQAAKTHFVQFAEKGSFVAGKYNNRILDLWQTAAFAAGR
jgi:hypothetical protein